MFLKTLIQFGNIVLSTVLPFSNSKTQFVETALDLQSLTNGRFNAIQNLQERLLGIKGEGVVRVYFSRIPVYETVQTVFPLISYSSRKTGEVACRFAR
jgi:hypothetical protein